MHTKPELIDSHCHFDDRCFDHDREAAYQRALAAGVNGQIIPSIKAGWWPRVKRICDQYPGLYPAYGMHPMFMSEHRQQDIRKLEEWIRQESPVAVGECGLDFFIEDPDRAGQQLFFEAQLELARQYELPVIIHARRAVEEVINSLRRFPGLRGVLHSFSGSEQQANRLIEMGFLMSFGGPITYRRATRLHQLVGSLPLNHIMLETDSPDQPDEENRGRRNEPARLGWILERVSNLRQESADEIAAVTSRNARQLFGLDPPILR
jgi:TatD DNase family protein